MKNIIWGLIIGLLAGSIGTALIFWDKMPELMLNVNESRYSFDQTYTNLEDAILEQDWDIQHVYNISECMENYGYESLNQISIFSICNAGNVNNILQDDEDRKVTAIMPCRIAVYEKTDGSVWVASLNIGLMSKMFGGNIESVMSSVAEDEAKMLESVLAD